MGSPSFRLEPLPGYAPTIGRLVGILLYARHTTLAAVEGLSIAELDHLQDGSSNSIGALLAHIAVVERGYHILTFEERRPTASEQAEWEPALTLGAEARRLLRDKPLEHYVGELSEARRLTLEGLATRDDAWLERALGAAPAMNAHFAWFHAAEDEINHRGQIRWLRQRLGSEAEPTGIALEPIIATQAVRAANDELMYGRDLIHKLIPHQGCVITRTADGIDISGSAMNWVMSAGVAPFTCRAPFAFRVVGRTDSTNLRMHWHRGELIFNWECSVRELRVHDPATAKQHGIENKGFITTTDWHEIVWEIRLDGMRVIVDREVRFDAPGDYSGIESAPSVGPCFGSTVSIREFSIISLGG